MNANVTGKKTMSEAIEGVHNYYDWILHELAPYLGASVLEIGPGYGNMAERLTQSGKKYIGIDMDQEIISRLQSLSKLKAARFRAGDVTAADCVAYCRSEQVDTILSMNVIEHIENDVEHVRGAARCAPGGRFVFFVPAMPSIYGKMDEEAGHYRRYTPKTLSQVISQAGLKLEKIRYFNFVGAVGWFVTTKLLGMKLNEGGTQSIISFHDKFTIPLSRLVDPVLRPFAGQSLVAVARIPSV